MISLIAAGIKQLEQSTQRLLDAILSSTENVPYGIRWICKQIRELTKVSTPKALFGHLPFHSKSSQQPEEKISVLLLEDSSCYASLIPP